MYFSVEPRPEATILRLAGGEQTNTLTRARVVALTEQISELARAADPLPLIITGNQHFFSAGADLKDIHRLTGPEAYEFAAMGQRLMNAVDEFPAATYAAVHGYCMGGGLDLALACRYRIAAPNAVFGHRGAALGLMTGWGGTQRLPRLIGKARALEMFVCAEKLVAERALDVGLVDAIAEDAVGECLRRCGDRPR